MHSFLPLLLVLAAATLGAEDIPLIDAADPLKGWNSNNGAEFPGAVVKLEADTSVTRAGKPSLKLTADLSKGGNYCDMSKDVGALKLDVESVSFWLKAPGKSKITMRLVDTGGRCHQINLKLDPPSDAWRLVSFPIARFFEKRGTAEAVQGVNKYESWGGEKGRPDGWSGFLKAFILLTGEKDASTSIWVSDVVASVRAGTTAWTCDFEDGLPAGWKTEGTATVLAKDAFAGSQALSLSREATQREHPCSATGPVFAVAPGVWEVSAAVAVDLESPDASYCGSLHLEVMDAAGTVIDRVELATPYGQHPWKVAKKQVRTAYHAASARVVARLNKTIGTYRLDQISVKPLDTAKKAPAVERIVLRSQALGNLLLPEDARSFNLDVQSLRKLSDAERTVTWAVRDYWGAEIAAPARVTVSEDGKEANRIRYRAEVDLAALPLEVGRYYEFHAEVPLGDNDPARNSAGFAILPLAASKAFDPARIPFTSRNWDNRIGEYIRLSDRLGFRVIGLWGGASAEPPHKAGAPGIELCAELNAAILTGCPARINDIEYYRNGWEKWTDEAVRGAVRSWFAAYGQHQPKPIVVNLGNEPHGTGEQVKRQVQAYKAAYDEIKQVAPDTIVVATSVPPTEEYFQYGYHEACDAFDFHVYETPEAVRRQIRGYKELMKKYNCEKPIWSTEIGLNSQGLTRQHIVGDMIRKFGAFFAEGGANMSWFDLLYPDKDGKALGTSGDSFNMFDSRYNAYAARLDAISCYNLINGILDKKVVGEKAYDDGSHLVLFRDEAGACFALIWRDAGSTETALPLADVAEVTVIRVDGRRSTLRPADGSLTLTVGKDPLMLAYQGPATIPAALAKPVLSVTTAPDRLMRGTAGRIELNGTAAADRIEVLAPAGWTVVRDAANPKAFTVTSPETSLAREGDLLIRVGDGQGGVVAELSRRPVLTGQLALDLVGVPANAGAKPAIQVVVSNQSAQAQTVTWAVTLTAECPLVDGAYAAPVKSAAYLGDAANGSLSVAAKSQQTVIIPVEGTRADALYQFSASVTDATGAIITASGDLKP